MPYATQSQLEERLAPELLVTMADDNADGVADEGVIAAALEDATAEIDQVLSGRYETPLATPPTVVVRWCLDLAIHNLYLRRREEMPAEQTRRADLTRRALESIANGLAGLAGATPKALDFSADSTRLDDDMVFDPDELTHF